MGCSIVQRHYDVSYVRFRLDIPYGGMVQYAANETWKGQQMRKCIEDVTALQLRLKKIIGQLTGVQKMLAEDVPCEDILTQLNAANGALHRLSFIILDGHLRHCVREGIEKGNADETIESFAEALESFSKMA